MSTSPQSNLVQVIAATIPSQPTPVLRSGSASTAITFSWTAPSNGGSAITSYIVQSNLGQGSTLYQIAVTGASTTSYQALNLITSVTYSFSVIAVNDVGQSLASVPTPLVSATTPGAPSAPQKVSSTTSTITISWNAPSSTGGSPITDY